MATEQTVVPISNARWRQIAPVDANEPVVLQSHSAYRVRFATGPAQPTDADGFFLIGSDIRSVLLDAGCFIWLKINLASSSELSASVVVVNGVAS